MKYALLLIAMCSQAAVLTVGSGKTHSTITACIAAASTGDECAVDAGTYNENITINKSIVVRWAVENTRPTLTGTVVFGADNAELNGFVVTAPDGTGWAISASNRSGITIRNNIVSNAINSTSSAGIYARNSTKVLIDSNEVFGCASGVVTLSCHSTDSTYANGCIISNNEIHGGTVDGIEFHGEYGTIYGNDIYDNISTDWAANHPDGIQIIAATDNGFSSANHLHIYNNHIKNHTQNIFIEGITDTTAEHARDIWIYNNVIYNDSAVVNGVDLDATAGMAGINIKYCISCNILNNYVGRQSGNAMRFASCAECVNRANNNVIDNALGAGMQISQSAAFSEANLDYNFIETATAAVSWNGTSYATLTAFRAAVSGWMTNSLSGTSGLSAVPTPKPELGSQLIGAGVDLTSLGVTALDSDKAGVARGATWDIGAYEYAAPPQRNGVTGRATVTGRVGVQ